MVIISHNDTLTPGISYLKGGIGMRRGRLLILLGIILGLATAVIVLVVLTRQTGLTPTPARPAEVGTATPVPTQKVWVALQPIPRGGEFVEGTLGLRDWPSTNVPPDVIGDISETIGRVAGVDIVQGQPILRSMLAEKGAAGQAALLIPEGRVAVAFPINQQSSVAYAVQPGDFVDVLIVASFIDFDQEFQSKLPNLISFLSPQLDENGNVVTFSFTPPTDEGRFERPPGLPDEIPGAVVYAREAQRPRRVAQLTVPAAKVLRVGPWIDLPTQQPQPAEEGQPPPPPPPPDIITLAVEPQDALVLLWARRSEMAMELALRAPGSEDARYQPEAVTLQYMLTRFNIAVPPKLEYGFAREAILPADVTPEEPAPEDQAQ
jgi:Flp pilus assembly protein CpaB